MFTTIPSHSSSDHQKLVAREASCAYVGCAPAAAHAGEFLEICAIWFGNRAAGLRYDVLGSGHSSLVAGNLRDGKAAGDSCTCWEAIHSEREGCVNSSSWPAIENLIQLL